MLLVIHLSISAKSVKLVVPTQLFRRHDRGHTVVSAGSGVAIKFSIFKIRPGGRSWTWERFSCA